MRQIETNTVQQIVNKANTKRDFTRQINDNDKRYTVSVLSIYKGKNPSLDHNVSIKVGMVLDNDLYDSIGGWQGRDGYCLDANVDFYSLDNALMIARQYDQEAIYDKVNEQVISV